MIQQRENPYQQKPSGALLAQATALFSGKWKLRILYIVGLHQVIPYNELWRELHCAPHNVLHRQLRELESDELVLRAEYPQSPPRVEYALTSKGNALLPLLEELCEWVEKHNTAQHAER